MTNWRARGEVPDSEDDDEFDSHEDSHDDGRDFIETKSNTPDAAGSKVDVASLPLAELDTRTETEHDVVSDAEPYFELRDDSADELAADPVVSDVLKPVIRPSVMSIARPTAKPISSRIPEPPEADIWAFVGSQEEPHDLQVRSALPEASPIESRRAPNPTAGSSSPLSSAPSELDLPPIGEIITSHGGYGDPSSELGRRSEPTSQLHAAPSNQVGTDSANLPVQLDAHLQHEDELRPEAWPSVQYQRSLRPRKPIQEHPYLLENARYSSILMSHGIRPLRASATVAAPGLEKPLPDGEFRDTSQDSAQRDQGSDNDEEEDSFQITQTHTDEYAFPSSSPPVTSPHPLRAQNSTPVGSHEATDDTSVSDHELPAVEELLRRSSHPNSAGGRSKRTATSPSPSPIMRKRRRLNVVESDPVDADAMPVVRSGLPLASQTSENEPILIDVPSSPPTPHPPDTALDIDNTGPGHELRTRETLSPLNMSPMESDAERSEHVVSELGHRIRGVLPASWLRLDQQSGRDKAEKDAKRRRICPSPERENRRGVAQKRQAVSGASPRPMLFEDSSDSDTPNRPERSPIRSHRQTELRLDPAPSFTSSEPVVLDDDDSVVEDNQIDFMLPGRPTKSRQLKLPDAIRGSGQKRSPRKRSSGAPRQALEQTRLTNEPRRRNGANVTNGLSLAKRSGRKRKLPNSHRPRRRFSRLPSPPHLSILDVIEAGAPRFLKIAARTARKRPNKSRSRPGNKMIQLATRNDHIDAMSVLRDWREGSILQRPSVTAAASSVQKPRVVAPLGEGSGNRATPVPRPRPFEMGARKLVTHVSDGDSISFRTPHDQNQDGPSDSGVQRLPVGPARPAQLELELKDRVPNFVFQARKKRLDRLYCNHGPTLSQLAQRSDLTDSNAPVEAFEKPSPPARPKPRVRKKVKSQAIDLEAPQYAHANDPLPARFSPDVEPPRGDLRDGKLLGLGPYGTNYTHHFEMFPLDSRVYFHESTLLGSGIIKTCSSEDVCQLMAQERPFAFFQLGDRPLKWGPFDTQVSSEMGILLDSIAEQSEPDHAIRREDPSSSTAIAAASFVLTYLTKSVTFSGDEQARDFVTRMLDCFMSFDERLKAQSQQLAPKLDTSYDVILRVYDYISLACLIVLETCHFWPPLKTELYRAEDCLKALAGTSISLLCRLGPSLVRETYNDLKATRLIERGLRDDRIVVHSWVVLLKVLEIARIPRASFWEVVQTALVPPQVLSSADTRDFERSWEMIFSLLPLTEFNDSGVIAAGRRHSSASDGWIIPQKLLKRVFQLYQQNARQSPSFNSYCRALIGRCHFLVKQWGWRKCASVVGTIFDFFGSQNLGHLRNEEVNESPRFLERLASAPRLDIEGSDACFHVFLKLVALSILKLREVGSLRDARNMVARTIPNHNRQYLKEQNVLSRDLAALRNHHDLLVTLFWASPSDLRPPVSWMERLVEPASSHKEACLINIRCWSQLARYVVATGGATQYFKPLSQWRNSFFQRLLQQLDSVAYDVQQQVQSLTIDISRGISSALISATISANRAVIMDLLYASASASLDVMKHAPDLEAATFAFNGLQLQSILKRFSIDPPGLPWGVLRVALSTLDAFLRRIDEHKEAEESQQSDSHLLDSAQADDALLLLEQDIAESLFSMTRCLLSRSRLHAASGLASMDEAGCIEQAVTLAARMDSSLVRAGCMRLAGIFAAGKFSLFDGPIHKLSLEKRRNLVLVVLTLMRCGWDDFVDGGFSLAEMWTLSLVKPREYLEYEMQLAQEIRSQGKDLVPQSIEGLAIRADYGINRDLFEFVMTSMRRSIRDAGPTMQKMLTAESSRTLKLVMEQIKADLGTMSREGSGHDSYVRFVRSIVSLIKTHGSDICSVDNFFLQMSKEYSPSVQDPNLQVAGLIAYGLRLKEGDGRSSQPLFFLLFNNAKFAIINDKLREEVVMLRRGMRNVGIVDFVLGKMLPVIVRTCFQRNAAFPMLDIYAETLRRVFAGKASMYRDIRRDDLPLVNVLASAALEGFSNASRRNSRLDGAQLHSMRQTVSLLTVVWPSIYAYSLSDDASPEWRNLSGTLEQLRKLLSAAEGHLEQLRRAGKGSVDPAKFYTGLQGASTEAISFDTDVRVFTDTMVQDVEKSWTMAEQAIHVQTPGMGRRGGAPAHGLPVPVWNMKDILDDWGERLREWLWWWRKVFDFDIGSLGIRHPDPVLGL